MLTKKILCQIADFFKIYYVRLKYTLLWLRHLLLVLSSLVGTKNKTFVSPRNFNRAYYMLLERAGLNHLKTAWNSPFRSEIVN